MSDQTSSVLVGLIVSGEVGMPGLLPPRAYFGGVRQPVTDLGTIQAHIPQLAIAKAPQESQVRLVLAMRNSSGNPVIDETAHSPREISEDFSKGGRGRGKV